MEEVLTTDRLVFGDYLVPGADPKVYTQVTDMTRLVKVRSCCTQYTMSLCLSVRCWCTSFAQSGGRHVAAPNMWSHVQLHPTFPCAVMSAFICCAVWLIASVNCIPAHSLLNHPFDHQPNLPSNLLIAHQFFDLTLYGVPHRWWKSTWRTTTAPAVLPCAWSCSWMQWSMCLG